MIIWITGLSGTGKTTIGREITRQLKSKGQNVVFLDGDAIRHAVMDPTLAHDRQGRLINTYRICRFAKLLEEQDVTVVVATMSMFGEIEQWNRENFKDLLEIVVKVDMAILKERDPDGLYSRAARGEVQHVAGIDLDVEYPESPDIIVDNGYDRMALQFQIDKIIALLENHFELAMPIDHAHEPVNALENNLQELDASP